MPPGLHTRTTFHCDSASARSFLTGSSEDHMNRSIGHEPRHARCSVAGLVAASLLLAACSGGNRSGDGGSTRVSPGNDAPVATLRASASEGTEPLTVTFDASASRDPDGRIVSYLWRPWGRAGGSVENTQSRYGPVIYGEGQYVVELVVTDDRGARSSATLMVRVAPGPRGKLEGYGQPVPDVAVFFAVIPCISARRDAVAAARAPPAPSRSRRSRHRRPGWVRAGP